MTAEGNLTCRLRGKLKQGRRLGDIVAVGDWVDVSPNPDDTGTIGEVMPRKQVFSRLAPTPRGEYHQIIIANPDQAVFVFACAKPDPHLAMLDRFLVVSEKQGLPSLIVLNKVDLVGVPQAEASFSHYAAIGYPTLFTSVKSGYGVSELADRLRGKISVFAGPSGTGKSSLLNAIQPGLGLAIRSVSKMTNKGRHTTVVRQLFPLIAGGYVADTPGLKAMALWDIQAEELDGYFPELRGLVDACQFNNCSHTHEPGCAVLAAVERGEVHPDRYASYVKMRTSQDEYD